MTPIRTISGFPKRATGSAALLALGAGIAHGAPRDVQISNIITESRVIALFNAGDTPEDLSGWRFCTHNTGSFRIYTSPFGFNGVTIEPGDTITVHLNNDADPGDPTQIDASNLGPFASFELDAYAIGLYFPNAGGFVNFGDGNLIADHLQWSLGGVDNTTADARSDVAVAGGVWTDASAWISVSSDTQVIELADPTFGELHGPDDYNVIGSCPADLTGEGELNFFDISTFLSAFDNQEPAADFDMNGEFNFFDVSSFLAAFNAGCP